MPSKILPVAAAATLLVGCSSMPVSQTTKDLDSAPQFSQEEKDAMTEEEKLAVYNESMTQEKNNLVCRRERPTGSHFKTTVCKTQEEIEQERRSAQDALMLGRGYGFKPGGLGGG